MSREHGPQEKSRERRFEATMVFVGIIIKSAGTLCAPADLSNRATTGQNLTPTDIVIVLRLCFVSTLPGLIT